MSMESGTTSGKPVGPSSNGAAGDPEYGDLLIVDILRPDWRHFFSRYRTDLIGFVVVSAIVVSIIAGTRWLAMIGAAGAPGGAAVTPARAQPGDRPAGLDEAPPKP